LRVEGNDSLSHLNELSTLKSVDVLLLANNDGLPSLAGLGALEHAERLFLGECNVNKQTQNQTNFDGLTSLKSVTHLQIARHQDLTSLAGLASLAGETLETVRIVKNPSLSQTEIDMFLATITVTGTLEVCENRDDDVTCFCGGND
jgi:hypothetical protein